ncbi:hypothetical protein K438DRAFT_1510968, partial [Mycena galopus ATCC 62051]
LLLWIKGALSPQEIRDRLLSDDSSFQKKLLAYLESVHRGDFIRGSIEEVRARRGESFEIRPTPEELDSQCSSTYKVPMFTLPGVPPPWCSRKHGPLECRDCEAIDTWFSEYEHEVDNLWLRCNFHTCNESGVCKASFPREVYETTIIDKNGHICLKKDEAFINTMSPVLTYFSRCNTDVTSLMSGTAVKAVVSYVSDYVSKLGLKTYQAFASAYEVFENNKE